MVFCSSASTFTISHEFSSILGRIILRHGYHYPNLQIQSFMANPSANPPSSLTNQKEYIGFSSSTVALSRRWVARTYPKVIDPRELAEPSLPGVQTRSPAVWWSWRITERSGFPAPRSRSCERESSWRARGIYFLPSSGAPRNCHSQKCVHSRGPSSPASLHRHAIIASLRSLRGCRS